MNAFLLNVILALSAFSIFAQTNTAAYDQLISQAGSQIASSNLDAAKQTTQQALQLDGQNWRGNALMAAILQKQNDFTNAQVYIQQAIANAPNDKKDKLNEMAKTIAASLAQSPPSASETMSPEARIKYNALMLLAQQADQATSQDDRKQQLREFMARSAAFLELEPDATNIWEIRALTAAELDYPVDGFYAGRKFKELGLETSDDPKAQKAFAELDLKNWLGENIKWRDWSKWTTDQARGAANDGDEEAQYAMGNWYFNGQSGLPKDLAQAAEWYRKAAEQGNAWAEANLGWMYENGVGVDQDYAKAIDYYRKGTDQGNSKALWGLATMYANGSAVERDCAQALILYRKAMNQNYSDPNLIFSNNKADVVYFEPTKASIGWYQFMNTGAGACCMGQHVSAKAIARQVFFLSPSRSEVTVGNPEVFFDVFVKCRESFVNTLQTELRQRFIIERSDNTASVDCWILTLKNQSLLTPVTPEPSAMYSSSSDNFSSDGCLLSSLASGIEQQLGQPCLDETGLSGTYKFNIQWNLGTAKTARDKVERINALLQPLGLSLTQSKHNIQITTIKMTPR